MVQALLLSGCCYYRSCNCDPAAAPAAVAAASAADRQYRLTLPHFYSARSGCLGAGALLVRPCLGFVEICDALHDRRQLAPGAEQVLAHQLLLARPAAPREGTDNTSSWIPDDVTVQYQM